MSLPCLTDEEREQRKAARSYVHKMWRKELVHPSTLHCTDCGELATSYDHYKGYAPEYWLDVEPVCHKCNMKRGRLRGEHRNNGGVDIYLIGPRTKDGHFISHYARRILRPNNTTGTTRYAPKWGMCIMPPRQHKSVVST